MERNQGGRKTPRFMIGWALAALMALFALTSCDLATLSPGKGADAGGKVRLRISAGASGSRTIAPDSPAVSYFALSGRRGSGDKIFFGWWADLASASVTLEPGTWDFTLDGWDANGMPFMRGQLNGHEVSEPGTLVFSLSNMMEGNGFVNVLLYYPPDSGVASVWANFNGSDTELPYRGIGTYGAVVAFVADYVPSNDYGLIFSLYNAEGVQLSSVVELLKVRDNLTSSKNIILTAADMASPPIAPASLTAVPTIGAKGVDLSWAYAPGVANTAEGYQVYRRLASEPASANVNIFSLDGGTTYSVSDADADLVGSETYVYTVAPYNHYGLGSASPETQTRPCLEVSFDSRGGTGVASSYVPRGQSLAALPAEPTKAGATFLGWYLEPTAGNDEVTEATTVMAGMTAYARWERTISFLPNGGAESSYDQTAIEGIPEQLTIKEFTRAGYDFMGWALTPYGAIAYADGASITAADSNPVLYARWLNQSATPASSFQYTSYADHAVLTLYLGTDPIVRIPEFIGGLPVTQAEFGTFAYKTLITSVDIGELESLASSGQFAGCRGLVSVTLNQRITNITANTFSDCRSLASINLHEGITQIGQCAFYNNILLTEVVFPASLTLLSTDAFWSCNTLVTATFLGSTPPNVQPGPFSVNDPGFHILVPAAALTAYQGVANLNGYTMGAIVD
jgi:hypothetical protein